MDFLLLAFLWCAVVSLSIPKMSIDAIAFCYPLPFGHDAAYPQNEIYLLQKNVI
jgi:hypothetical protein